MWLETVVGTRIYLVAFMLVWSGGFAAVLVVLAIVLSRPPWLRVVLAAATALELLWGALVFAKLRRTSQHDGGPPLSG